MAIEADLEILAYMHRFIKTVEIEVPIELSYDGSLKLKRYWKKVSGAK